MGLFKRLLGGGGVPPPGPNSQRAARSDSDFGSELREDMVRGGPFPKRMRVRGFMSDYSLAGSWQEVLFSGPGDFGAVREQVLVGYYKQFGLYRLPDGSDTIRWNEALWRDIRDDVELLYDPAYQG